MKEKRTLYNSNNTKSYYNNNEKNEYKNTNRQNINVNRTGSNVKLNKNIKKDIDKEARFLEKKRRKKERLRNQLIFLCGLSIVISFVISSIHQMVTNVQNSSEEAAIAELYPQTNYDLSAYVFDAQDPKLILVNYNSMLASDYYVELDIADSTTGKQLQIEAAAAFRTMSVAANGAGVSLILQSGYRDNAYQTELFEQRKQKFIDQGDTEEEAYEKAKTIVALPGASEHATGLAADIVTEEYQVLDVGFAQTQAYAWLTAYAADYGFILRYPEDRQAITGIVFEPWHWRYVGVENAKAIKQSGVSLEEFLEKQGDLSQFLIIDPLV